MAEPIVTSELHFYRLSDKAARDVLRRAAADAKHGPVWLINKAGERIGAVVTPDDVDTLTHLAGPVDGGVTRHTDHDPSLACRPALGAGLCYPVPASEQLVPWREVLGTDGGER